MAIIVAAVCTTFEADISAAKATPLTDNLSSEKIILAQDVSDPLLSTGTGGNQDASQADVGSPSGESTAQTDADMTPQNPPQNQAVDPVTQQQMEEMFDLGAQANVQGPEAFSSGDMEDRKRAAEMAVQQQLLQEYYQKKEAGQ